MKTLLIDFASLASITRFAIMQNTTSASLGSDADWVSYFLDSLLLASARHISVLKPDRVIFAIESRSWRKTHYPPYKANRAVSKEKDDKIDLFYEGLNKAVEFFNTFTNAKVIRVDGAEGDDIIAVAAQHYSSIGEQAIILSNDGDFNQLLRYPGVKIFSTIKKVYLSKYSHLDYITKLVKGDYGDNVPSSYLRMSKDTLISISQDEKKLEKVFEEVELQIKKQRWLIQKFLELDEFPEDLTEEEWEEVINIAKDKRDNLKKQVSDSKDSGNYAHEGILKSKEKLLKNILKYAKNADISESKLFSVIEPFKQGFERNKKLICLKIENLPEEVVSGVLHKLNEDHSAVNQKEYMKFVRDHKLKKFAFSDEWNVLKAIKNC